jgi:hypothetical protein
MAILKTGASSAGNANVNANYELEVHTSSTPANAGFTKIAGRDGEALQVTRTGYIKVTQETLEFFDTIDGAAINTNLWNTSVSTMTVTQANSAINLNPTNSTTANAYAILSSIQTFFNTSTLPLYIRMAVQSSLYATLPANTVVEFGWMTCATNAAPSDGVFVRVVNGLSYLVLNNNGTETVTQFTIPGNVNSTDDFLFNIYGGSCKLFMNNVLCLDVNSPTSLPAITNNNRQPVTMRVYNTASIPSASATLKLGQISVVNINANFGKPYSHILAGFGRSAIQNPVTTFTQVANYANSAAPASATLANATAGYATLGGQFQFAAVAGAETDYALFGFQVPAGYQLYITGIRIAAFNTVVPVAVTATVLQWAVGVNSSAVSLATADGAGTWKPRVKTIGSQNFAVGAAVGASAVDVVWQNDSSPLCIDGGRFFHVILKMPVATATATEIIRGTIGIDGWFE